MLREEDALYMIDTKEIRVNSEAEIVSGMQQAKKRKRNGAWANSDDSDDATEGSFFDPLQDGVFRAVPPGLRGSRVRISSFHAIAAKMVTFTAG